MWVPADSRRNAQPGDDESEGDGIGLCERIRDENNNKWEVKTMITGVWHGDSDADSVCESNLDQKNL